MPQNTMVLTIGCGKFRIFDQDFGTLPGTQLPRLLDMGQCNDAYGAVIVATVSVGQRFGHTLWLGSHSGFCKPCL